MNLVTPESAVFLRRHSESARSEVQRGLDYLHAYVWRDIPNDDEVLGRAYDGAARATAAAINEINLLNRRLRERECEGY